METGTTGSWLGVDEREGELEALARSGVDLVVVGAGANGLAAARDACLRGYRTLVIERDDVGSGTTRWSGRQIHGGLRYLEHGEIGLVRESLRERETLLAQAPHLVRRSSVLLPVFDGARRPAGVVRAGTLVYDALIADVRHPRRRWLGPGEARASFARLRSGGLRGAVAYADALVPWPERLCIELAQDVCSFGGIVLTHARVDSLVTLGRRVRGVGVTDAVSARRFEIPAEVVLNVAGPWADEVLSGALGEAATLVGGTKGTHLVIDAFPGAPSDVVYAEHPDDGRMVSLVRFGERILVGSTDIRTDGSPDAVDTDPEEVSYLLRFVDWLAPGARAESPVRLCYCGVRPLPTSPGKPEGSITRRSLVVDHAPRLAGLVTLVGGKLTTHRHTGELLVDAAERAASWPSRRSVTKSIPLPGARGRRALMGDVPLQPRSIDRLLALYGAGARRLAELVRREPALAAILDEETGAIAAEVVHAVDHEGAKRIDDVLWRRTMLGLEAPERIGPIVERTLSVLEETGRLGSAGVVHARREALAVAAGLSWPRGRASGAEEVAVTATAGGGRCRPAEMEGADR